jgi:Cu-Zn family superoxide dismutase
MANKILLITVSLILMSANGCMSPKMKPVSITPENNIRHAICILQPTEGNQVSGVVNFTKEDKGIRVVADIHNLSEGKHGFHIHEYGDLSMSDGTSTGGHFNPDGKKHGSPTDMERHVGDLGNVTADSKGDTHLDMTDTLISFEGPHSIIGRGVIVHAGEDDFVTQPTGNAGKRVAYGVIGIAKNE